MEPETSLRDFSSGWAIEGLRDATLFFRHVHLLFPPGATLVLEESSMAKDIREVIAALAAAPQGRVAPGTLWPRSRMHWVDPTPSVLERLSDLSTRLAEPEICDHVYAVLGVHSFYDGTTRSTIHCSLAETSGRKRCRRLGRKSAVHLDRGPMSNHSMQRPAPCAAADAGR